MKKMSSFTQSIFGASSKKGDNDLSRTSNISAEDSVSSTQDMEQVDSFSNTCDNCDNAEDDITRLRQNSTNILTRSDSFNLLRKEATLFFKEKSASTSNFVNNTTRQWGRSLSFDKSCPPDTSHMDTSTDNVSSEDSQPPVQLEAIDSVGGTNLNFQQANSRDRATSFDIARNILRKSSPDFLFPSRKRLQDSSDDSHRVTKKHISSDSSQSSQGKSSFDSFSRLHQDFQIIDEIGVGTFGSVFSAQRKLDNMVYAVKQSRQPARNDTQERSCMLREVQTLALLNSEETMEKLSSIVRYYSSWIEDDLLYIQMELCEAAVNVSSFDASNLDTLFRDMLSALEVIHKHDIAHLDVKPGNILMKGPHYKLCDFGKALKTENGVYRGDIEEGDSRYMAQELLEWACLSDLRKCDIFSLGVTGYELMSGKHVAAEGPQWHDIRNATFDFADTVPEEQCQLLASMMGITPDLRPTASECIQRSPCLHSTLEHEVKYLKSCVARLEGKHRPLYQQRRGTS